MFLRSLVIENIRSIAHLALDFSDPKNRTRKWTILLGENGTGKSTVLRSAALVLRGSDVLPALMPEPEVWIRNGAKQARIVAQVSTARNEIREIRLELKRGQGISELVKSNHKNLEQLDAALRHAERNYFVCGYGASRRLTGSEVPNFSQAETYTQPRAQGVTTLYSRDAALRALDAWAMDLDYRLQETGLKMIREALGELLPDVAFSRINRQTRQLLFNTPDGEVSLQQLSDGYQNMAAWTGDLLFRITETFRNYRNPLHARGLLLLDEIDLHLHPKWQRQLLLFIDHKLPNFQILATTHSPFTAQQASPGALHVIERGAATGSGVLNARQYSGDPKLLRVEQLLEPLLGLETSESSAAQTVREKQRTLKRMSTRTAGEAKELHELTQAVRVLPEAQALDAGEKARLDLLNRIEQRLGANGGVQATRSRKATGAKKVAAAPVRPSTDAIESVFRKMALQPGGPKVPAAKKTRKRSR